MIYLGIDPGKGGGIVAMADGDVVTAAKMPETPKDLLDLFRSIDNYAHHMDAHAILERVHSSPQMGVVSAFTFGRGVGNLEMALLAVGIPYDEVSPRVWQKAMGCLSGGDKNVTKRRAQQLFPLQKVTHATADALLIAEYGRRLRRQE